MNNETVYNVIGIGIGPFNLGLAALSHPISELKTLFLDQRDGFDWHPGLMIDHVTLQTPFLCDCVSMADPTHPLSLLNYLKETDRLYKFFIRENFFIPRKEYNRYCQWVIKQLPECRFSTQVTDIEYENGIYLVSTIDTKTKEKQVFKTERLVLGTGTQPHIPSFIPKNDARIIHTSSYLYRKEELLSQGKKIAIIGSGQSAAEVFYDLLQSRDEDMQLGWYSRPDRFFPMEYSKLTLELTSPDYVEYFYSRSEEARKTILSKQQAQFKGINYDLINDIYDFIYDLNIDNADPKLTIIPNSQLDRVNNESPESLYLEFTQLEQEVPYEQEADYLILGTGYRYHEPLFLKNIQSRIKRDSNGLFAVNRNYSIDENGGEIYVLHAEVHTHSYISTDLGMAAYRNSFIINDILGREHYKVEKKIAFQDFDVEKYAELPIAKI
ncbi:alcaligin biosynthesis protein [Chryseobacterium indologenes]|uniref:lysine N(6)-hydroxylase/L-ornithine N(5)-oxygenase family protein n=1 Tax=Chryseobacterium indologenes TaxID=253 RepID=UPI000F516B63|nr:SidA/IucD/PvdA family monooxygenase [Chryseobacterium indologenes]AYZ35756.1 alcaligin biosynthesis protein [Chryseobacterium indologenes]MBF6644527.1 SidA/IucD/PvdA family monooxygenase [Chryseobacterium indologenes]MBU3047384.1 SidA/IucD/PvdA family monooxygenase [Chryseobacterium indologenes]MEB4759520.1 SidA/IucD/PvdA family monooxygenase [Chryseobacterium indologenes]QQQ71774.1 SidA/IucD/PvdA family monooxygenase [Chryseobacterium indologenes]